MDAPPTESARLLLDARVASSMFSISTSVDAARARRRHRDDLVAEEGAADRRALLRLIRREIRLRDEPAVRRHVGGDAIGDPPRVEHIRTVGRDGAQASSRDRASTILSPAAHGCAAGLAVRGDRRRKAPHRSALGATSLFKPRASDADITNPCSARSTAGMTTSFHGSLPNRLCASAMPRTVPGTPGAR